MYPLIKQEAAKKVGQLHIRYACIYYCCVRVNTVRYGYYFRGNQFFMDFVRFLYYTFAAPGLGTVRHLRSRLSFYSACDFLGPQENYKFHC